MSECYTEKKVLIYQGADASFDVLLMDEFKNFYDLTGTTALKVLMKKADGTILEKTLIDGVEIALPESNGKITVTLSEVDTASLKEGLNQSIEIEIVKTSDTKIVQLIKVLDVKKRLFS